jgi:hypothetical protein
MENQMGEPNSQMEVIIQAHHTKVRILANKPLRMATRIPKSLQLATKTPKLLQLAIRTPKLHQMTHPPILLMIPLKKTLQTETKTPNPLQPLNPPTIKPNPGGSFLGKRLLGLFS